MLGTKQSNPLPLKPGPLCAPGRADPSPVWESSCQTLLENPGGRWLRRLYLESTRALVAAVEAKDACTEKHSVIVSEYCERLGVRLGMSREEIVTLKTAAILHDIGKIGIPDSILLKPGPLTASEFSVVRRHPERALQILGHASFLKGELPLILHHHERYDGSGYPGGLIGDAIPLGARVLAVADATEAMLSLRGYKPSYDVERVQRELALGAGVQFDPDVASVAIDWLDACPDDVIVRRALGGPR
jgi:HD-GYP domain-containing protein (c-di-GMP phosphodiesterase class II)